MKMRSPSTKRPLPSHGPEEHSGKRSLAAAEAALHHCFSGDLSASRLNAKPVERGQDRRERSGSGPAQPSEAIPTPATRMFAAWSGQDAERVGRDPQALLASLRAVGEDVREIMRDAVSGDPARHARAEARLAELKRLQAEARLVGEASPETASAAAGSDDDRDSPEARFRGRLQTILEEAVGRLERLKTEVERARSGPKTASDDEAAPRTGEGKGKERS